MGRDFNPLAQQPSVRNCPALAVTVVINTDN